MSEQRQNLDVRNNITAQVPANPEFPPEGLASQQSIDAFIDAFMQLEAQWGNLSPQQRLDEIKRIANETLRNVGLPEIKAVTNIPQYDSQGRENGRALFNFQTWQVSIRADRIPNNLTRSLAADLANKVYHEIRHSEQFFRVAQTMANGQLTNFPPGVPDPSNPKTIEDWLYIHPDIAQQAAQNPQTAQIANANRWFDSYYTKDGRNYDKTVNDILKRIGSADRNFNRKVRDFGISLPDEVRQRVGNDPTMKELYLSSPLEGDAWPLGQRVEDLYLQRASSLQSVAPQQETQTTALPSEEHAQAAVFSSPSRNTNDDSLRQQSTVRRSEPTIDSAIDQLERTIANTSAALGQRPQPTGVILPAVPQFVSVAPILAGESESESSESSDIDEAYRAMRRQQQQDMLANRTSHQQAQPEANAITLG